MKQTISIITPSLNQGQYIEETIKSVLSQEGDFFIDYIISDGGSTDETIEIIKKYDYLITNGLYSISCLGIKFRWWSKNDRGQSDAINQGFKIAKGEIIAYINSDDYYETGAFKKALEIFENKPNIDLVYGSGYFFYEDTGVKTVVMVIPTSYNHLLFRGCNIFQPSTFIRHSILKKVNYLDENLHYVMDYDLWLKIFMEGKAIPEEQIFSTFRYQPKSKTVTQSKKFIIEIKKLRKKYGGNIVDITTLYKIISKIKMINYLKINHPRIYSFFLKIFYLIIDKFKYNKKI